MGLKNSIQIFVCSRNIKIAQNKNSMKRGREGKQIPGLSHKSWLGIKYYYLNSQSFSIFKRTKINTKLKPSTKIR